MAKDITEIIALLGEEERCNYCPCQEDGCTGGVSGGPNGPAYPPCCDLELEDLLYVNDILEAYDNGEFDGRED